MAARQSAGRAGPHALTATPRPSTSAPAAEASATPSPQPSTRRPGLGRTGPALDPDKPPARPRSSPAQAPERRSSPSPSAEAAPAERPVRAEPSTATPAGRTEAPSAGSPRSSPNANPSLNQSNLSRPLARRPEPSAAALRWLAPSFPGRSADRRSSHRSHCRRQRRGRRRQRPGPIDPAQAREAVARYCLEMGLAAPADEIFSRVREREHDGPALAANAQERLLAATGTVVADALAVRPAVHTGWRQVLGAEHEDECLQTLRQLALAADGQLDGHDQRTLERHLESCLPCQALEIRGAGPSVCSEPRSCSGPTSRRRPRCQPQRRLPVRPSPRLFSRCRRQRRLSRARRRWLPQARGLSAAPAPAAAASPCHLRPRPARAEPRPVTSSPPGLAGRRRRGGPGWRRDRRGAAQRRNNPSPTRHPPASAPVAAISTPTRSPVPTLAAPKPVKKRHRANHRGASTHPKAASVSSTSPATTTQTNATPSTQVAPAPTVTPPPVTPASPAPSQPTSSGSISASQQGSGLPAQSAPTQTIGSLGSPPPKH